VSNPSRTVTDYLRTLFAHQQFEGLGDSAVLRRFVETRDDGAFACLVRRHGPMVYGLARRIVRDHQLAEDVFQATFLVLARKPRAIRGGQRLPAWLHRVAFRLAVRAKVAQRRFAQPDAPAARPSAADLLDDLTAREFLTILDEELNRLPEKYRLPLIMCQLEGLSREDAAKRLNVSPDAVKGSLERGRNMLRVHLAQRGLDVEPMLTGLLPPVALVPPALVQSTVRAAMTYQGASLAATSLAKGAITMMFLARVKTVCAVVLLCGVVGSGAGWLALGAGTGHKEEPAAQNVNLAVKTTPAVQPKNKGVDLYGDPLPDGAAMRLGTVQLRAAGAKLAISADGKTLVGVRGGKYLSFWNVESGKLKERRELETPWSFGSVFSADGRLLVTGRLEVWDVPTGKLVRKLELQGAGYPGCTAFSPDGTCLTTVHNTDAGLSIRVWDLESGKETFARDIDADTNPVFASFTPDGKKLLASFMSSEVGTCCWDVGTNQLLWQNKNNGWNPSPAPVFSADGKTILSLRPPLSLDTGEPAQLSKVPGGFGSLLTAMPDGQTFLISGEEGVRIWDMAGGKLVRTLAGAGDEMLLAPDGKTLITNNGSLQRWDLATGKALYSDNFDQGHTQKIAELVFSGNGQRLASAAADGSVRLWDVATGQPIHVWRGHRAERPIPFTPMQRGGVDALDITPDGQWVISAGSEQRLKLRSGLTGKEAGTIQLREADLELNEVYHLRISPDGKSAVGLVAAQSRSVPKTQGESQYWLTHWDLQKGSLLAKRPVSIEGRSSLSRDGKTLVAGRSVVNVAAAKKVSEIESVRHFQYWDILAMSPDGALITGDCEGKEEKGGSHPTGLAIWETATGKTIADLKTELWTPQLAFHPRMPIVAIDGFDDGIQMWDLITGKVLATPKLPGGSPASATYGSCATCMAFTPDGRHLATGHNDGTILLWKIDLPASTPAHLPGKEIASLWADLKGADAAKAWKAVWRLVGSPDEVVPFLRDNLKPFPPAPANITDPLLTDLASDVFAKRDAANKSLKEIGLLAEPALRQRLQANPPLEVRQRVEVLLKAIAENPQPLTAEALRDVRAVAVLARINSPQARQILEGLTKGVDSAPLTGAAKAALGQ
jgi:RNA polymerase sigma factor (sigma-70 family)